MSYAAIMVHAESAAEAGPRLNLAANIANSFSATLIGVGAEMIHPIVVGGYGEALVTAGEDVVIADLKTAEVAFRAAAREVKDTEWRVQSDFPAVSIARNARAADLIIAGPQQTFGVGAYTAASPGDLLMQCGRPILIAPRRTTELDAHNIVVGWKDTREARRAVSDAMPFLKRAAHVLIVGICEGDEDDDSTLAAGLRDVATALARHGVKASTAVRPRPEAGAGADLMHVASLQEAGLVVAGGYGHSRMREWLFGGVTQEFLVNPQRPVLLSR